MKYLLILSCLLFTSVGWSKDINSDELIKRDGLYYEKFKDVPFTGDVVGKEQGKISKGKREGEYLTYYENGQLKYKSNYKEGVLEGEWLYYHDNGQLRFKENYKDGKLEGEWLYYHDNGQLRFKRNWKDGKKEGEWLYYHETGQLETTEIYKDGELIKTIKP